jgi:transposase InsO family protein
MEMAIKNRLNSDRALITHSERGIQYCCPAYTDIAKKHGLLLSTTQNSSPYENAVAERLNGILKYDPSLKVRTGAAVWIEPSESKFKNCRKNDKTSH